MPDDASLQPHRPRAANEPEGDDPPPGTPEVKPDAPTRPASPVKPWEPSGHQVAFLSAYAISGSITKGAEAAGISRQTHYLWLKEIPEYKPAFEDARAIAIDMLEERAIERARDGWDEPVYHDGKQCGTIRRHSDRLIEFLIKYNKPDVYKDRRELTGKDGAPLLNLAMMDKILAEGDDD